MLLFYFMNDTPLPDGIDQILVLDFSVLDFGYGSSLPSTIGKSVQITRKNPAESEAQNSSGRSVENTINRLHPRLLCTRYQISRNKQSVKSLSLKLSASLVRTMHQ